MSCTYEPINLKYMLDQLGGSETGHNLTSLLKELIDNGLDAGSTSIRFYLKNSSTLLYEDNGNGMSYDEVQKCIQIYSNNTNDGIGKFGIGGVSALVNFSDINSVQSKSQVSIISKHKNTVYSLIINWKECTCYDMYKKYINSIKINNTDDVRKMNDITSGTRIEINTSPNKCMELEKLIDDWDTYQDIETCYNYFIKNGVKINIFETEIESLNLLNNIKTDTLYLQIWKNGRNIAYSTTIGNKPIVQRYTKSNKLSTKKLSISDLDNNWTPECTLALNLKFMKDNYKPLSSEKYKRTAKQFCYTNNKYLYKLYDTVIQDLDDSTFKYLISDRYKNLNVGRTSSKDIYNPYNIRNLGKLEIILNNEHTCENEMLNHIEKTLIFISKNDKFLGLVQQNKSCLTWNNTPKNLSNFITAIIKIWSEIYIVPILNELDQRHIDKIKHTESINKMLKKKHKFMVKCSKTKYEPLSESAANKITSFMKIYLDRKMKLQTNMAIKLQNWWKKINIILNVKRIKYATTIQRFFHSCKLFKTQPINGFIKFRSFIKWTINYNNALLFSKLFVKFKEYCACIAIQKKFRGYLTHKQMVKKAIQIQCSIRYFNAIKTLKKRQNKADNFINEVRQIQVSINNVLNSNYPHQEITCIIRKLKMFINNVS